MAQPLRTEHRAAQTVRFGSPCGGKPSSSGASSWLLPTARPESRNEPRGRAFWIFARRGGRRRTERSLSYGRKVVVRPFPPIEPPIVPRGGGTSMGGEVGYAKKTAQM